MYQTRLSILFVTLNLNNMGYNGCCLPNEEMIAWFHNDSTNITRPIIIVNHATLNVVMFVEYL